MINTPTASEIKQMKRDAHRAKKATGVSHTEALNHLAALRGYSNWSTLMRDFNRKV